MTNNEWIKATKYSQAYCPKCGMTPKTLFGMLPPYCPNCGNNMKNNEWIKNEQTKVIK